MSRLKPVFMVFVLASFFCLSAIAQQDSAYFGVLGNISIPIGEFSDDINNPNTGLAKGGLGGTFEYSLPVSQGLYWSSSVSLLVNFVNDDLINEETGYEMGPWFNIPVLTGVRYHHILSASMTILLTGQVGLGFVQAPTTESNSAYQSVEFEASAKLATTFGFGIGAGFLLNDRIIFGVQYLDLGKAGIEYESKMTTHTMIGGVDRTEEHTSSAEVDQKIAMFAISVGFILL